jgi:hypothetical protein
MQSISHHFDSSPEFVEIRGITENTSLRQQKVLYLVANLEIGCRFSVPDNSNRGFQLAINQTQASPRQRSMAYTYEAEVPICN